jgi:hypothetical protein
LLYNHRDKKLSYKKVVRLMLDLARGWVTYMLYLHRYDATNIYELLMVTGWQNITGWATCTRRRLCTATWRRRTCSWTGISGH